jgi:hypothetical protein
VRLPYQKSAHLHFDVIHTWLPNIKHWPSDNSSRLTYAQKVTLIKANFSDPAVFFAQNHAEDIRNSKDDIKRNSNQRGEKPKG